MLWIDRTVGAARPWVAALVLVFGPLGGPPSSEAMDPACGDVRGRVVDASTGQPLGGATVSLLQADTKTDGAGEFCFRGVKGGRTEELTLSVKSAGGEPLRCEFLEVKTRFLPLAAASGERLDVQIVDPETDGYVELRLRPVPSADVDAYCVDCHRWNPCLEDASREELIASRRFLAGIFVKEEEAEALRADLRDRALRKGTYRMLRYTDSHAAPMDMRKVRAGDGERYRVPRRLDLVQGRTTCDTCHTRHLPTRQPAYAVMPFDGGSELCRECHL